MILIKGVFPFLSLFPSLSLVDKQEEKTRSRPRGAADLSLLPSWRVYEAGGTHLGAVDDSRLAGRTHGLL